MSTEIELTNTNQVIGLPQMSPRAADHGDFRAAIAAAARGDTPDFILAQYLANCLDAFDVAIGQRAQWYVRIETIGGTRIVPRPVVADTQE